jgi:carbonic anhydrase/acetyltransferase-like protein (isoleucine patch superfamily)
MAGRVMAPVEPVVEQPATAPPLVVVVGVVVVGDVGVGAGVEVAIAYIAVLDLQL